MKLIQKHDHDVNIALILVDVFAAKFCYWILRLLSLTDRVCIRFYLVLWANHIFFFVVLESFSFDLDYIR